MANISQACYLSIRKIGRIRKYISTDCAETLINAYVTSKLDCNNALLYKLPKTALLKLQRIQNNAARVISRSKKYDSTEEVRKNLHWLPIEQRVQHKINVLTYKAINGLGPTYLSELLMPHAPSRSLRSGDQHRLHERKARTTAGDRAFSVSAPYLWNRLPESLRQASSVNVFKNDLKTHLFERAFKC